MAVCPKCGAVSQDDSNFCSACGATLTPSQPQVQQAEAQPVYQPPQYQQQQYQQVPPQQYGEQPQPVYQQPQYQQAPPQSQYQQFLSPAHKDAQTAKTLGIIAIVCAFFWQLVSWICGGIGISKANNAINYANQVGDFQLLQEAEQAKKLNKIGLIVSIAITAVSIILAIIMVAVGVAAEI